MSKSDFNYREIVKGEALAFITIGAVLALMLVCAFCSVATGINF